jgi:hypothetical protein
LQQAIPLLLVGLFIHKYGQGQVTLMQSALGPQGEAKAQPIQGHITVITLTYAPYPRSQ